VLACNDVAVAVLPRLCGVEGCNKSQTPPTKERKKGNGQRFIRLHIFLEEGARCPGIPRSVLAAVTSWPFHFLVAWTDDASKTSRPSNSLVLVAAAASKSRPERPRNEPLGDRFIRKSMS
jgi:hypothetical protein